MKSDPQVIAHLNAQLKNELTATNQYFLHYRMLKHWGFNRLAKKEYEESIGEMKHADQLMERIFMLDGLPNLQDLGKLLIGENAIETMDCDLKVERASQAHLKEAIAYCERHGIAYQMAEPKPVARRTMAYADNFAFNRRGSWTH